MKYWTATVTSPGLGCTFTAQAGPTSRKCLLQRLVADDPVWRGEVAFSKAKPIAGARAGFANGRLRIVVAGT